jgi:Nif-specific regulatory protein
MPSSAPPRQPLGPATGGDHERLALLLELTRGFNAQRNVEELLPLVIRRTKELLNAEGCSLLLADDAGRELHFPLTSSTTEGVDTRLHGLHFPVTRGIAGEVFRTRSAMLVNDVPNHAHFNPDIDLRTGSHTRNLICAPLRSREGVLGVIEVINHLNGNFQEDDLDFLDALANSVALAVETAQLVGDLREVTTRLSREVSGLRRERVHVDAFPEIIGRSPSMQRVFALMESAADSAISVQIQGETGVGKELVARAIHSHSARASAPLVAINCGAMPATLLESELFGFSRGAFTGATRDKTGLFEAADGGTLFLDEINAMPIDQQTKLLRVIQEGELRRLGETVSRKIDVRLISASNSNLAEEVAEKRFREDLYYRLNVFPITLPPLRERTGDIPLIANSILQRISERSQKELYGIDRDALETLDHYAWPGNVRELENELERATALTPAGSSITRACLSERVITLSESQPQRGSDSIQQRGSLREARQEFERHFVASVLRLHSGNATKAAKELGISRQMLQRKIRDWNLREPSKS